MKKLALVFIAAVLVPSLSLAWLAMSSLRDQEIVVQSQLALLHQARTDALAADLRVAMDDIRSYFGTLVDELVTEKSAENGDFTGEFDARVRARWGQALVACVVSENGDWLAPSQESTEPRVQEFLREHRMFLTNRLVAEVYQAPVSVANVVEMETRAGTSGSASSAPSKSKNKVMAISGKLGVVQQNLDPQQQASREVADGAEGNGGAVVLDQSQRQVEPFSQLGRGGWENAAQVAGQVLAGKSNSGKLSTFQSAAGDVQEIIGNRPEGALSRFLDDGLHLLLWYRHPEVAARIFWVELDLEEIRRDLASIIHLSARNDPAAGVCVALLDSEGHPVARTRTDFSTDWKRPFVASEVGEILPHWEVAAYLLDPSEVISSARGAKLTLLLMVPTLLAAIGIGSLLIFRDIRREVLAARQKTDFVSNVSHELKTPLTSIRMFSDLLGSKSEVDPEKSKKYAGIISTEAARLTRLINNLLDFSGMEQGKQKYAMEPIDAVALTSQVVESYRMQIESEGVQLRFIDDVGVAAVVEGDSDALSQVLLNLLSNAEKYGAEGGEVVVRAAVVGDQVQLSVMDRGQGISRRETAKVFEKFYRIDDSLSSGIQGSGLGLTLARQIARGHGGDVECCARPDRENGGCFVLRLPLMKTEGDG